MKALLLSLLWRVPLALVVLLASSWGVLALYFRGPESLALRLLFITLWLLPALAAIVGIAIPRSAPLTVAGRVICVVNNPVDYCNNVTRHVADDSARWQFIGP